MKSIRLKRWSLYLLASLVLMYSYNTFRIYRYADNCSYEKSDAAIVLGAGSANGKLSPVFRERVNHAILLYGSGLVDHIIFTGGFGKGQRISDSRAARDFAVKRKVPFSKIFIEEESTITYSNLTNAREIMDSLGLSTALLVSDPLHMKRAMAMCEKTGLSARPSPTQTTMYRSFWPSFRFLMYEAWFYNADLLLGHI